MNPFPRSKMAETPEEHSLTSEQAFELALRLHQGGQYKEAESLYRGLIDHNPQHIEALHLLGVLQYLLGKNDEGNKLMMQALKVKPDFAEAHFLLANGYQRLGKIKESVDSYRKTVELQPGHAQAHSNLGLTLLGSGDLKEAEAALRMALNLAPDKHQTRVHLGTVLKQAGKPEEAVTEFQQALAASPNFAGARNHLSHTLMDLGRLDEAEGCLRQGIGLKPEDAEGHYNLALVLAHRGKQEEAITHYREAVKHGPDLKEAHSNLANLLLESGEKEEAAKHFIRTLELEPENKVASYLLKIANGEGLERAPLDYIRTLFDHYARDYDRHNIEDLKAESHILLKDSLLEILGTKRFTNALDLGCGTGIGGVTFREQVDHLTGVDLSPAMIEQAYAHEVYDVLREGDIPHYLERSQDAFDFIVAIDSLPYFGNLLPLFTQINQRLMDGGLFCFNTELSSEKDWQVQASGRFAHHQAYLKNCAQKAGLKLLKLEQKPIRLQREGEVLGNICILQKINS